jgi:hypothetical protein
MIIKAHTCVDGARRKCVWTEYSFQEKQKVEEIELNWLIDLNNGDLVKGNKRYTLLNYHYFTRIECSVPLLKSLVTFIVLLKKAKKRLLYRQFICTSCYRNFSWYPSGLIASFLWGKNVKIGYYVDKSRFFKNI